MYTEAERTVCVGYRSCLLMVVVVETQLERVRSSVFVQDITGVNDHFKLLIVSLRKSQGMSLLYSLCVSVKDDRCRHIRNVIRGPVCMGIHHTAPPFCL